RPAHLRCREPRRLAPPPPLAPLGEGIARGPPMGYEGATKMNALAQHNAERRREVEVIAEAHVARHRQETPPRLGDYPLPRLKARIAAALSERWGKGKLEPQIELISREQFGGDLTLKFPQLLADGGPKGFAQKHLPWIV